MAVDAVREITLTQNQIALVDEEDFERINRHKWCAAWMKDSFRAIRTVDLGKDVFTNKRIKKTVIMTREIMFAPEDKVVDHKNHNTLDNQKHNLRVCTPSQNTANSKPVQKYKGITREGKGWKVQIQIEGKLKRIGNFISKEEAALAYDVVALKVFGEYATLNF